MDFILAWIAADFITGIVHWFEDRVLILPESRFLQLVASDNEVHHSSPGAFLKYSLWENMNTSAVIAWPVSLTLLAIGAPAFLYLAVFFSSFGNVVHRFAHEPRGRLGWLIKSLQFTGFFISKYQHDRHHFSSGKLISRQNSSRCYCVLTSWLNPALDYIRFFDALNFIFRKAISK